MESKKITTSKVYSAVERKIFLDALARQKNIIENKKSDSASLQDKKAAWGKVAAEYNNSQTVSQERSVAQLKKLWANLKQGQRDILTKERQNRLATGGGPEVPTEQIDPDIAGIAPHLMQAQPFPFTSNVVKIPNQGTDIENPKAPVTTGIELMVEPAQVLSPKSNPAVRSGPGEGFDTDTETIPGEIGTGVGAKLSKSAITDSTPYRPNKRARLSTGVNVRGTLLSEEAELKCKRIRQLIEEDAALAILKKQELQLNLEIAERRKNRICIGLLVKCSNWLKIFKEGSYMEYT